MGFRDDKDAMYARSQALERELEDTKRALAEKEQELAEARNPPREANPAAPSPASAARRDARANGDRRQPGTKQHGRRLAAELLSEDAATADAAKRTLRAAPPIVTDAAAHALVGCIRSGGKQAEAVYRMLVENDAPKFGGRSYGKLFKALMKAEARAGSEQSLARQAFQKFVGRGVDNGYVAKKEAATADGSTSLVLRIASVAKRSWVIVVLGLPALIGIPGMFASDGYALHIGLALSALAIVVVAIDAQLRRCPSCRKRLAGKLLSIVGDNYGGHTHTWRCVFCRRKWST